MTLFTSKNRPPFLTNTTTFKEVERILKGIHSSIPTPKQFSLENLLVKYRSIKEATTNPFHSFKVWKSVIAWEIGNVFREYTIENKSIYEVEFCPKGTFSDDDKKLIECILLKFDNKYQWIIDNDHILKENIEILKNLIKSENYNIIEDEFIAFFPYYSYVTSINHKKYWSEGFIEIITSAKQIVNLYHKSLLPLTHHPVFSDSAFSLPMTDAIVFLWLNQNDKYFNEVLPPRGVKQLIWSDLIINEKDQKLFSAWLWQCARKDIIKGERIRESKSNDYATIQNNIIKNDEIIYKKLLILKIFKNSLLLEEIPIPKKRKKILDFKTKVKDSKTNIEKIRGEWKNFKDPSIREISRINEEIIKNDKFIYTYPYSKLQIYTRYSKEIIDEEFTPRIAWNNITSPKPKKV